jgi:L-fucose mutarotase
MGHGDDIVFADANFPSVSHASNHLIQCCGHPVLTLLLPVLKLFPLDYAVDYSAILMQVPPAYEKEPPIWENLKTLLAREKEGDKPLLFLSKPDFYARAKTAFAVVATGELQGFSNVILRKGIITGV